MDFDYSLLELRNGEDCDFRLAMDSLERSLSLDPMVAFFDSLPGTERNIFLIYIVLLYYSRDTFTLEKFFFVFISYISFDVFLCVLVFIFFTLCDKLCFFLFVTLLRSFIF